MKIVNTECYHYEKKQYNKGFLDECIDATYIIHLEGNGRLDKILNQLRQYQPSKIVYIFYNKGYLNSAKPDYINSPARDLVDANLTIFTHAHEEGYENILVLEDDFFFNDLANNSDVCNKISEFINIRKEASFLYTLGCIPVLSIPWSIDGYHYLVPFFCATHACIFTKSYRDETLAKEATSIWDWDHYTRIGYMYCEPICYQTFPETENKLNWGSECNQYIYILILMCKWVIFILRLDCQAEPGYRITYTFSKCLFYICIYWFWVLLWIFYFVLLTKKENNTCII